MGEFPAHTQASKVLTVIGAGETTFRRISVRANLHTSELSRSLHLLTNKGVVAVERPLSTKPSRETRYRVADPYLRFWLRFIYPHRDDIERGRGDLVAKQIREAWSDYRGVAIEPIVREAIICMLPDKKFGTAKYAGGWWNRTNTVQIDLVGADHSTRPKQIAFVGSTKWRNKRAFGRSDTARLIEARPSVPGASANSLLVGVSRCGFQPDAGLDVQLGPDDLLNASENN
jgi:hypothetical protein